MGYVKRLSMTKLSLIALFTVISTVIATCPFGWVENSGECLYFSHARHTWQDAEAACRKLGHSFLTTIDSAEKQSSIKTIMSVLHHNHQSSFWLGSNDIAVEGHWRWEESGKEFGTYTNWGPGYPDNNETHNCLLNTWLGSELIWIDTACRHRNYYICEVPSTSTVIG